MHFCLEREQQEEEKNRQALEKLEEQTTLKLCPDDDV